MRWIRWIGPGLAAVGAMAIVAASTLGARDRPWEPPPCRESAQHRAPSIGTWWRMDPRLERGRLVGQRLAVAGPGSARPYRMDLDAGSFAAGPFDGQVLVGTDDGRHSTLSLVDPGRGCARALTTTSDLIRRATLTPRRDAVVEFRVDRTTRADLGVFLRPLDDRRPVVRVLAPIAPDPRFGRTWTTELAWSPDGRALAVQSCGAVACRTRILDWQTGRVRLVARPSHGDLVGLTRDHLVLHEACGGSPCAVVAVDIARGDEVTLDGAGWGAVLVMGGDGRAEVVLETGVNGQDIQAMGLDGADRRALRPAAGGRRLLAAPGRSASATELPPGVVLFGAADGRLPIDGVVTPRLRRLRDDADVTFDEVAP